MHMIDCETVPALQSKGISDLGNSLNTQYTEKEMHLSLSWLIKFDLESVICDQCNVSIGIILHSNL